VGVFLAAEVLVGAYMWLSLGPLQDPFRGKNTFARPWTGGLSTSDSMAGPDIVLDHVIGALDVDRETVQMIEWRHSQTTRYG